MTPELVDSHCHLDFADFAGELPQIIARARAAGVSRMVTICTRLRQEPQVRAIAEAHDGVFYAAGTHPMSAAEEPMATVGALVALARYPKFVGIGESFKIRPYPCVMHCFSSGAALARTALDLGFYLSMSGIAAFPRSDALRAIFAAAPLERILLETDSPYLAPPPHRGHRNEPAYTAFTAKAGAAIFGISVDEFAAATTANFDRLFSRGARKAKVA